jgi:hypothetical protein
MPFLLEKCVPFLKKNQKTGDPTSFYFAAEGGEIPLIKPRCLLHLHAVQK